MACQAVSATTSLRDALKASLLCLQRTLDLRKISAMTLNSTCLGRGTSLILYMGAVVMPRCSSRARSLPVGTELQQQRTPPRPHLGTSSRSLYRSGEVALHQPHLLCHGSSAAAAPLQASPEPLGSRGPPALSKKTPPDVMRAEAHWVVTPGAVAHSEVPADQRVDDWCSCVRCGECESSII
jgi:hypothetical protein